MRRRLEGLTQQMADDLAKGGVTIFHGVVRPGCALFIPVGYMMIEATQGINFGVRVSACTRFRRVTHMLPSKNLQMLAELLEAGKLKNGFDAVLARALADDSEMDPGMPAVDPLEDMGAMGGSAAEVQAHQRAKGPKG